MIICSTIKVIFLKLFYIINAIGEQSETLWMGWWAGEFGIPGLVKDSFSVSYH